MRLFSEVLYFKTFVVFLTPILVLRCRDNDGYLPLHMAAQVGDLDVCRYLVSIFRESGM